MNTRELINRCAEALDVDPKTFPTIESLDGFFQKLRPDGTNLNKVIYGTPAAEAVRLRVASVFNATAPSRQESDAYFVIRRPSALSIDALTRIGSEHLRRCLDIANLTRSDWLLSFLIPFPVLRVDPGASYEAISDFADALFEAVNTFIELQECLDSDILLLRSAVYHMTCDPLVTEYVLWPCYKNSFSVAEPFGPYFDLWKHGSSVDVSENGVATIYNHA